MGAKMCEDCGKKRAHFGLKGGKCTTNHMALAIIAAYGTQKGAGSHSLAGK